MSDVYLVAKQFEEKGCVAYQCGVGNEERCIAPVLEIIRGAGMQLVILNDPEMYGEYAPYEYVDLDTLILRVLEKKKQYGDNPYRINS